MKIVSLDFEVIRATPAVAEFLVRVRLDGPITGCEITGQVVGPRCPGVATVEVAYPMTAADMSDDYVRLRCVIPEPNLCTAEAPFIYSVTVELRQCREVIDTRKGTVALRGVSGS